MFDYRGFVVGSSAIPRLLVISLSKITHQENRKNRQVEDMMKDSGGVILEVEEEHEQVGNIFIAVIWTRLQEDKIKR